jgi:hypothetical protein
VSPYNATIHAGSDMDLYIVQGARLTSAERIFIAGFPALEVYGNDSLINLEVFHLKPDNSQGALVESLNGVRCAPAPLEVRLDEDAYYLMKVSGSPGRYTLRNSVDGEPRRFPELVHDRVYEVFNPGEPVEHVLRFPDRNPGAEMIVEGRNEDFADWERLDGLPAPRRLSYAEGDDSPSPSDPGSKDRGSHLFGSGDHNAPSGLRQSIPVDREWKHAIEEGRVGARLSGFLGGRLATPDLAAVKVTFLDINGRQLSDLHLQTVGPREREGKTGLLPVESNNTVPAGTAIIRADLTFSNREEGRHHGAYADNLELMLSEYSQ